MNKAMKIIGFIFLVGLSLEYSIFWVVFLLVILNQFKLKEPEGEKNE